MRFDGLMLEEQFGMVVVTMQLNGFKSTYLKSNFVEKLNKDLDKDLAAK